VSTASEPQARTPRLVGRRLHVDLLEEEFERARQGRLRVVLLNGDPGVGKTSLTKELLRRHDNDAIGLTARAYPLGTTNSLGLWVEALEGHLRTLSPADVSALCGSHLEDLAALLPSVATAGGRPAVEPPRVRLLGGLAILLANLNQHAPLIVVLDDVHLADGSSWEALNYLTRNLSTASILVVIAGRTVELLSHAMASDVILGLEQEGFLRRDPIAPLAQSEIEELAAAVLDQPVQATLVTWLMERSQGSPLFAVGLLRALVDEGADLADPVLHSLPEDLAERVEARLRELTAADRSLLELVAVVGARVELDELIALWGRPLDDAAQSLETLVHQRLLVEEDLGRTIRYEVGHPLIQEAIYGSIGAARRRALHRFVARALVTAERYGSAAGHFVRSASIGDVEAIEALTEALRQAEARTLHRESLALLQALLEIVPAGDQRWLRIFEAMAWQAEWIVDHRADVGWETGLAAMRRIDHLLEGTRDTARRAVAKFHVGSFLVWGEGELAAGLALIEEARELFTAAGRSDAALLALNEIGYVQAIAGDEPSHRATAERVITLAEEDNDRLALLQGCCSLAHALLWGGIVTEAPPVLERALELARADRRNYRTSYLLGQWGYAASLLGEMDRAHELIAEGRASTPDYRDTMLPDFETFVQWIAGDLRSGLGAARESMAWDSGHISRRRAFGASYGGMCALELGEVDEAVHISGAAAAVFGGRDWWIHSAQAAWLQANIDRVLGDTDAAVAGLETTARYLGRVGAGLTAAFVVADLADLCAQLARPEPVRGALSAAPPIARPPAAGPQGALADFSTGALAIASSAPADAVADLGRAVNGFDRAGWTLFAARSRVLLARALAPADRDRALEVLTEAATRFETSGAVHRYTATLDALDGLGGRGRRARAAVNGPGVLTKREHEVAALAVTGLQAREIGARLFIGERTVETHLGNIYAKLGVTNRLDLARRFPDLAEKVR